MKLFTPPGANPKLKKGDGSKWLTMGLSLAPYRSAGCGNFCLHASPGCIGCCLNMAGRGQMSVTQQARINRTKIMVNSPELFKVQLYSELQAFVRKCDKLGVNPAVRLNVYSDVWWEFKMAPFQPCIHEVFTDFPTIQFYDYTKAPFRCMKSYKLPSNYHLTFSRSEINQTDCKKVLRSGKCNVAVVFANELPSQYFGRPVINGDETDLRFTDPSGVVVGLLAKGKKAKNDSTGFVVRLK